jgi:hypothetical protein
VRVVEEKAVRLANEFARGLAAAELDGAVTDEVIASFRDVFQRGS